MFSFDTDYINENADDDGDGCGCDKVVRKNTIGRNDVFLSENEL